VGLVLTTTRDRKVRTAEELEAAIEEPMKVAPDHTGRASGRSWVPGAGRPWGGYRGSRQTRAQNCRAKGLWSPGGP